MSEISDTGSAMGPSLKLDLETAEKLLSVIRHAVETELAALGVEG